MHRNLNIVLAASMAVLLSSAPVLACEGTPVFSDDFSFADPAWGNYDGTTIGDGKMTISVEQGKGYTLLNQSSLYTDFDACIDVVQHNDDPGSAWASLVFWGVDFDNFYTLDVAGNGYVKVSRLQSNKWLSPIDWTLTDGVVNAGEEVNHLRVVAVGNVATVFVNGKQVGQFRGQPPAGGSLIGVYGAASDTAPATYDFTNFSITAADAVPAADSGSKSGSSSGSTTTNDSGSTTTTTTEDSPGSKRKKL